MIQPLFIYCCLRSDIYHELKIMSWQRQDSRIPLPVLARYGTALTKTMKMIYHLAKNFLQLERSLQSMIRPCLPECGDSFGTCNNMQDVKKTRKARDK